MLIEYKNIVDKRLKKNDYETISNEWGKEWGATYQLIFFFYKFQILQGIVLMTRQWRTAYTTIDIYDLEC